MVNGHRNIYKLTSWDGTRINAGMKQRMSYYIQNREANVERFNILCKLGRQQRIRPQVS